jgi:poly(A) polymerase
MTVPPHTSSTPAPGSTPGASGREAALFVQRTLRGAGGGGFAAYFAGGCVRDELLGREPSDYDIATDATPDQIEKLFRRTAQVGAHFGVVLVRIDAHIIEVATFRSDGSYSDSRRPDSVQFSSPAEDARRRDFTVNALFLDPDGSPAPEEAQTVQTPGGLVIDFVGGLGDLSARLLRAVGDPDARLREDHLRALRAVRLAAKLDLTIEDATARALRAHAAELRGVSTERIGGEVLAMLTHPSRARAAGLLCEMGLEPAIFAGARAWDPAWTLGAGERVGVRAGCLGGLPSRVSAGVALAAWMLDLGVGGGEGDRVGAPSARDAVTRAVKAAREALCLSNADQTEMLHALEGRMELLSSWSQMSTANRKRLAGGPRWTGGFALIAATDAAAAAGLLHDHGTLAGDGIGIAPAQLLTGDDLSAIGIRPGPLYKTILNSLYDAQLEGRLRTREEALMQTRELAARFGVS